jgi:alpha-glucoside transport system substrate-binding protein
LDTRVQAGTPPDVAFWQVAQLVQYQDQLQPMDALGADAASYNDFFLAPMTMDGKWLGLPIKADVKSIIWYSPANFEALGYTVPTTWEELDALVEKMVADAQVPWSMGFESGDATGWTGTTSFRILCSYSRVLNLSLASSMAAFPTMIPVLSRPTKPMANGPWMKNIL